MQTACSRTAVLALVSSAKTAKTQPTHDAGASVTTHAATGLLADECGDYTWSAQCTSEAHTAFMLAPPKRANRQAAVVVVRGTLEEHDGGTSVGQPVRNFLVEPVLPRRDEDTGAVNTPLAKPLSLIAHCRAARRGGTRECRLVRARPPSQHWQTLLACALPNGGMGAHSHHIPTLSERT